MNVDVQLGEAVTAVRNKNNNKAHQLLAGIIRNDPRNVHAWLLLSYAIEQKERQIECLHHVLRISPDHSLAKKRLFQLETAVEVEPVQHITRIQPFDPIPRSELAAYRLELLEDAKDAKSQTLPEAENQIEIEPPPNVVELLFEDVTRLPIISNLDQELWLGIQLAASRRWHSFAQNNHFDGVDNETTYLPICATLVDKYQKLDALCLQHDIKIPNIELWIGELLSARRDIYQLKQSKLRRFLHRAEKQTDKDTGQRFLETAGVVGEIFCWFPNAFLIQISNFIYNHNHLPPANEMSNWLASITTLEQLTGQIKEQSEKVKLILVTGHLRSNSRSFMSSYSTEN